MGGVVVVIVTYSHGTIQTHRLGDVIARRSAALLAVIVARRAGPYAIRCHTVIHTPWHAQGTGDCVTEGTQAMALLGTTVRGSARRRSV